MYCNLSQLLIKLVSIIIVTHTNRPTPYTSNAFIALRSSFHVGSLP